MFLNSDLIAVHNWLKTNKWSCNTSKTSYVTIGFNCGSRHSDTGAAGGGGEGHPDSEIRGSPVFQNFFSALLASVWFKNKEGGPPLDLPLGLIITFSSRRQVSQE